MSNTSILVQFENILKKCILDYFKNILSSDKISLFSGKNYIDNIDFTVLNNRDAIQGYILRGILNDIVDVKCTKNINGTDVVYGNYLNELLIEYYARDIAKRYQFNISINQSLDDTNEFITLLQNTFKENLNKYILNIKVDKLLSVTGLESITNYLDNEINVNNEDNSINLVNEETISEEKSIINDNMYTSSDGRIEFYDLNGTNYFKYVDNENKENVVALGENSKVHEYFIDRIKNLSNTDELKSGILYLELLDVLNTENKFLDVNNEQANETINNLDYTTVLDPEQIQKINDELTNGNNENEDNIRKLTPKEYEDLCIKYSSGEELTPEQLNLLKSNSPELLGDLVGTDMSIQKSSGKISKKMIFIFAGIGLLIVAVVLFLLLK